MNSDKTAKFEFDNYILMDKIKDLAIEYATTTDFIINTAAQKLIDDVEFIRKLRSGDKSILSIRHQGEQK